MEKHIFLLDLMIATGMTYSRAGELIDDRIEPRILDYDTVKTSYGIEYKTRIGIDGVWYVPYQTLSSDNWAVRKATENEGYQSIIEMRGKENESKK